MKTDYCYVILDAQGSCWLVVEQGTAGANLPEMLADGWRPVRETPFPHTPGQSHVLICLERQGEGQMGFGFGH
jgi:hypothetical protein